MHYSVSIFKFMCLCNIFEEIFDFHMKLDCKDSLNNDQRCINFFLEKPEYWFHRINNELKNLYFYYPSKIYCLMGTLVAILLIVQILLNYYYFEKGVIHKKEILKYTTTSFLFIHSHL